MWSRIDPALYKTGQIKNLDEPQIDNLKVLIPRACPSFGLTCHTYLTSTMGKPKPAGVQSTTFFPPLAIQQSVWDSILNGNFIDAKIFAFSRRSRKSGRVDTPKVLFVNIHVLASACTYFQSSGSLLFLSIHPVTTTTAFSFSEGIETRRDGELPPGVESFFDLEDCDLDSDFDCPVEDDPVEPQAQVSPDVSECPQKPVKAYLVKYTAYRTLGGQ